MKIGAVSGGGGYHPVAVSAKDPRIESIDRQIEALQNQIKEAQQNEKIEQQARDQLIMVCQQQIAELQSQKQQIQMESRREQTAGVSDRTAAQAPEAGQQDALTGMDEKTQKALISLRTADSTSKALKGAQQEARHDRFIASHSTWKRPVNPAGAQAADARLAALNAREAGALQNVSEALMESAQEIAEGETGRSGGTGRMEPGQFLDDEA